MIKKNDILILTIEDITNEGFGVARADSFILFIANALPQEVIEVRVEKVLSHYGFAKGLNWIRKSPHRSEIYDLAMTSAGTMPLQHIEYPYQLALKKKWVYEAINNHTPLDPSIVNDTIGMEEPLYYRNKAQIPCQMIDRKLTTGFYRRNSHKLIPIENFYIQNEEIDKAIVIVRDVLRKYDICAYDEKSHQGLLRHIVIKRGHYTKEMMIILVINGETLPFAEQIVKDIKVKINDLVSLVLSINTRKTNVIMGDKIKVIYGKDHYEDLLLGKRFKISPLSFYQVNTLQTEKLYRQVLNFAKSDKMETVLDAYCGIGTITLNLADIAKRVYGVEVVKEAIAMAKDNALINKLDNVEFYADKAEHFMSEYVGKGGHFDVIVVDPPRKGLHDDFIKAAIKAAPERVVYVSCNPVTLGRDLKKFVDGGYEINRVQPLDMFPFSSHVESVALLKKTDSNNSDCGG